ncbi:hypothetical protein [Ornithinimicrobium avium]|uniref:Uncharacterized protein n=1 Tax=Ornithinimicrobium avium TaxID=2283195 RepID=A0A345NKH7_9MICO|nr:hypothetical protein [Ornithinimicrobium avium]AXH95535.1 hypothetical protein DV701_04785 [Ornithinimicrobium avium]
MSAEQKLQWIALPQGTTPAGLPRLAAFLAPRLRSEGNVLADLPDLLAWPTHVAAATWHVEVDGTSFPASVAGPAPDADLWAALFPPETPVMPFRFADHADRPLVTYGVRAVLSDLRRLYATTAVHGADLVPLRRDEARGAPREERGHRVGLDELLGPFLRTLDGRLGEVRTTEDRKQFVGALLQDARARSAAARAGARGRAAPVEPMPPGSWSEHERALLFHTRPEQQPVDLPPDGTAYRDRVDLHQMLGALGDHPDLLRRLGLVVDLVLDEGLPRAAADAPGLLAVVPTLPAPAGQDGVSRSQLSHLTAYVHDDVPDDDPDHGTLFVAARAVPDPLGPAGGVPTGLAPVPQTAFALNQVDVDGALLKTLNLAATVARPASSPAERPLGQPDAAGLPALRTTGLGLVHTGRAGSLQQEFVRALEHDTLAELDEVTELHAEDLVRGHRLDVLDTTTGPHWRSLHARVLTARAERFAGTLAPMPGEGFLTVSLAGPPVPPGTDPDPDSELYVPEVLATWDGWSLSAPRPGASLSRDARAPDEDAPETLPARVGNDPHTTMGLSLESRVAPGSLPRLRFGHAYRVRLREVDLAGGGLTLEEADSWLASPAAATPAVPAQGATPYLRFEPVPAPAVVPAQPFGEGASALRLVVRSDVGSDPQAYAAGSAGDLEELGLEPYRPHDDRHVAPPKAAFETVERHGMLDVAMSSDGTPPTPAQLDEIRAAFDIATREKGTFDDPGLPGARVVQIPAAPETGPEPRDAREPARYVVLDTPTVELPYLPDPLAAAVLLRGLPGTPEEGLRVETAGAVWHRPRPFRLRLTGTGDDGGAGTTWDEQTRVLTVRLPQATTLRVRLLSVVEQLDLMGILSWCEEELTGDDLDRAVGLIKTNSSWLVTPWHELELVHAVQHPLVVPDLDRLTGRRDVAQTSFDLAGLVPVDPASTDRVEVGGSWSEWVDEPGGPPRRVASASTAFALPLSRVTAAPPDDERAAVSLLGERMISFDTRPRERTARSWPQAHEFGDTRHRRVTWTATAASSFREDFPAAWLEQPGRTSVTGAGVELDVPSSAVPPPPAVLHAIPTLGWESTVEDGRTTVTRRGGGVRVWMARGWYASGDGELLGVVTGRPVVSPEVEDYDRISILAADPARRGTVPENLSADLLGGASTTSPFLPLPGGTRPVQVVGFEPAFDEASGRWYCDVDVDTGTAYQPFLRLSLVRYQPSSLPGCHLSAPVLVDILQTLPDRVATVVTGADDPANRTVTVAGPSYDAVADPDGVRTDGASLARMTVRVQRRDPAVADEELGWVDDGAGAVELDVTREGGTATWSGRIGVPDGGGPLRLLVLEEERWSTDPGVGEGTGTATRVVYAVHLPAT